MNRVLTFPKDFDWGYSSSAYQIEGAVHEDGRGPSIWDRFCATPGKVFGGHTGEIAIDAYHQIDRDVAQLVSLGARHYRFSVAWPRVVPSGTGAINPKGLDYYQRLIDALLKVGIEPWVTLYHWDLPQALEDRGGWRNRDTSYAFRDYSEVVVRGLGDRVNHWMTLNELPTFVYSGYRDGTHAPGAKESAKVVNQVGHHAMLAHGLGVQVIRALGGSKAEVGTARLRGPQHLHRPRGAG